MAAACVIGVDLGGTKLLAGAVDAELEVHHRTQRTVAGLGREALLGTIAEAVQEASDAVGGADAAGFGIPSLMDSARGVAVSTVHLPIVELPFAALMAERLGLPVAVDNDGNCAMLAEHGFGAAQGADHALLLAIGTGIAGGIVVDGRLVRGATGAAGEPGHMTIDENGPPCHGACPGRGCLETYVSGTALGLAGERIAARNSGSPLGQARLAGHQITGALVTELAFDGDDDALDAVTEMGEHLGVGLAGLINLLNPDVVVIGGGVIAAGDLLLAPARRVVAERALAPSRDVARIVPSRFGAESGMLGAAVLAMQHREDTA
jgi:glucokinase